MTKLLRIRASGYRLLADDFEIDFLAETRVSKEGQDRQILPIADHLNTFRSLAFVGGNASGKSTVLSVVLKVLDFLDSGRWLYLPRDFHGDALALEVDFYQDGYVYFYHFRLKPNPQSRPPVFCLIDSERLIRLKYDPRKGRKIVFCEKEGKEITKEVLSKSLSDSSHIVDLTGNSISVDAFPTKDFPSREGVSLAETFLHSLKDCPASLKRDVVRLLDDGIEDIQVLSDDRIRLKRFNEEEMDLRVSESFDFLSSGTVRGIALFRRATAALKAGGILVVDGIENSFHRSLVENILFLFNDSETNKRGAQLVFSTHCSMLLDVMEREDSIFIASKDKDGIHLKNMSSAFNLRSKLSKSKLYDNNVFNSALNYEQLMKVRKEMEEEVKPHQDGKAF